MWSLLELGPINCGGYHISNIAGHNCGCRMQFKTTGYIKNRLNNEVYCLLVVHRELAWLCNVLQVFAAHITVYEKLRITVVNSKTKGSTIKHQNPDKILVRYWTLDLFNSEISLVLDYLHLINDCLVIDLFGNLYGT